MLLEVSVRVFRVLKSAAVGKTKVSSWQGRGYCASSAAAIALLNNDLRIAHDSFQYARAACTLQLSPARDRPVLRNR